MAYFFLSFPISFFVLMYFYSGMKDIWQPKEKKARETEREREKREHNLSLVLSEGKWVALVFTAVPPFWISFGTWLQPTAALTHAHLPLTLLVKELLC